MSPSEEQLRAALRDGENGAGVDADTLIAHARGVRHAHRVRVAAVVGACAVVAGVGALTGALVAGGRHHAPTAVGTRSSTSSSSIAQGEAANPAIPPGENATSTLGAAGQPAVACPAALPQLSVPQHGAGPLFSGPVASVVLCSYPEAGGHAIVPIENGGQKLTNVLTGSAAGQLVSSLETSATTPTNLPCPLYRVAGGQILDVIGIGTNGIPMAPVEAHVLQNTCNQPVTNGTAVRYNWSPPAALNSYLRALQNAVAAQFAPGTANGSPAGS